MTSTRDKFLLSSPFRAKKGEMLIACVSTCLVNAAEYLRVSECVCGGGGPPLKSSLYFVALVLYYKFACWPLSFEILGFVVVASDFARAEERAN